MNLRLRRGVKKWLSRKYPPQNVRAHVLQLAASEKPYAPSIKTRIKILASDREDILSFERFAKAKAHSLQMGVLIV